LAAASPQLMEKTMICIPAFSSRGRGAVQLRMRPDAAPSIKAIP
jgi:hypothetical protein